MIPLTSLAIALSLSMDSFAAALGRGACQRHPCLPEAFRVGVVFGICQFAMPLVGWLIGHSFVDVVQEVDHWIAFVLLLIVGGLILFKFLGATPTAIANMTAVTQQHGAAHRAFIIVPLVCGFFIDIVNALIISAFVG